MYRSADTFLSPTRKETNLEAYQGRARFQQHLDASCYQGAEGNSRHSEKKAYFLPGKAKDLSAPLYNPPSHTAVTPSVPSGLQTVPLQSKAPKETHAILTETLACFLPGLTKDLSAPL